jgi:hypothetical protein
MDGGRMERMLIFFGGMPNEGKAQMIRQENEGERIGRVHHKNSNFLR